VKTKLRPIESFLAPTDRIADCSNLIISFVIKALMSYLTGGLISSVPEMKKDGQTINNDGILKVKRSTKIK